MASEIYLLAIDDVVLADFDIDPGMLTNESDRYAWSTRRQPGVSASAFFGSTHEDAAYSVIIKCPDVDARDAIMGSLISDVTRERRLLAYRNDYTKTRISTRAAVTSIEESSETDITVEFEAADSIWTAEKSTITRKTFSTTRDQAMYVSVPGNTRVSPSLRIAPLAQRTAPSVYAGWSKRRRYTYTHAGDAPLYRYPWRIALGSTTALVTAGTMQADGDDIRVVIDGVEQPRTVITPNTGATYVWFIIPALLPGDSLTVEVWYGNAAATSPPVLAYPDLPPFTLSSSSNTSWVYPTGAGVGLWWLSSSGEGAIADFAVPGAWQPLATLENPDTTDLTHQLRASFISGSSYGARMDAGRAPANSTAIVTTNPFDGVGIYNPLGISAFSGTVQWNNTGGWGSIVTLGRDSASEGWQRLLTKPDATTDPLTMSVASISPAVKWLSVAIWPDNFWNITPIDSDPDATPTPIVGTENDQAWAIGNSSWTLTITSSAITEALSTVTSIPWTPAALGGRLQLWHDASAIEGVSNNAGLSQWPDLSGNARHAGQGNSSWRPQYQTNQQNGLPGVDFDGTDDDLISPLTASSRDQAMVIALHRDGSGVGVMLGSNPSGGREFEFNGSNQLAVWSSGVERAASTATVASGADAIVAVRIEPTQVIFAVNGTQEAADSNSTALTAGRTTLLGAESTFNSSLMYDGDLYEVVVLSGATLADIQNAEGYLAWKWGMTSVLPGGHPYKTVAPGTVGSVGGTVTEEDIYELATEVRVSGGDPRTAPYTAMLIGNARQETGSGTPRAACLLSQQLLIDADRRTHEVWTGDLTSKVESLPTHAVQAVVGWDDEGTTAESPTSEWLPVLPRRPTVPNADFSADIGGWDADTTSDGLTVTRTWDGTLGGVVDGSLNVAITANTGAAGVFARTIGPKVFPVADRESVTVAAWMRTTNVALRPRLYVTFADEDGAVLQTTLQATWTPVANEGVRRVMAAAVPSRAVSYRIGISAYDTAGTTTGSINIDDISVNDTDAYIADEAVGQLEVVLAIKGKWL